MNTHHLRLLTASLAALTTLSLAPLDAQLTIWNNTAGDSSWSNDTNWSNTSPNTLGSGAIVQIGTQPTSNLIGVDTGSISNTIVSLTFNNTLTADMQLVPQGNETLTVDGAITNSSAHNISLNLPVLAGASATYAGGTGGSLNFGTSLDLQTFTVTMTGAVNITGTLAGTTGKLIVGDGATATTVLLTGNNNGSFSGGVTIAANGTLQLGNGGATGSPGSGGSILDNGTLTLDRSGTPNDNGTIVSGTGNFIQEGAGSTFTITAADTLSGTTSVTAGSLDLSNALALQNSTLATGGTGIIFDSSVVSNAFTIGGLSGSGNLALQNNAGTPAAIALSVGNNNGSTTYTGVLSGAGSLIKIGSGTLTLSTGTNTYTGVTTITAGTLAVNSSLAAGSTVGVGTAGTLAGTGTVNGNATLTGSGIINFGAGGNIVGTLGVTGGNWNGVGTVAGQVTSSSGTFTIGSGANLTATTGLNVTGGSIAAVDGTSTITGNVNYTSSTGSAFGGVIAGAGKTLTMNSAGVTLTLSGINTYTGATTITAGTLSVTGSTAAGSTVGVGTAGTLAGTGTVNGNATLTGNGIINFGINGNIVGTLGVTGGNWNGGGSVGGTVTSSSGTFTIGSAGNLTAPTVNITGGSIAAGSSSSRITGNVNYTSSTGSTFAGAIFGAGNTVTMNSTGTTLTLSGVNTYTGATTITAGTLAVTGSTAAGSTVGVGTAGTLSGTGTVNGNATLTGGGIINFGAGGNIVGTLGVTGGNWNGVGTVASQVTSSSGTFTIGSGANLTATTGVNVTGGSIVAGNSSSTITGNVNYTSGTGSTFGGVIAGSGKTLTMNSGGTILNLTGASTYTGATSVSAGTLELSGTGSLGATATTVSNGATLAVLGTSDTVGGGITLNNGSTLNMQSGTTHTLNGTTLTVASGAGTLSIDVSTGTTSDLVSLSGAATLAASSLTVNVNTLTGATVGVQYTFLTAAGGGLAANDFNPGSLTGTLGGVGDTLSFSVVGNSAIVTVIGATGTNFFYTGATSTDFTNMLNYNTTASGGVVQTNALGSTSNVFIGTSSPTPSNIAPVLNSNLTISTLSFTPSGSTATLSGTGTLTIDNGLTVETGVTGTETISAAVALGASQTWTITDAGSTLDDTGVISGTGFALTKAGAGTLILTNANTYSGGTTVSGGELVADNSAALGAGAVTLSGGGTLAGENATLANAINLGTSGGSIGNFGSTATATFSGPITLGGNNLTIFAFSNGGASTTVSGGITGTGNLTLNSGGSAGDTANVIISGASVNNVGTITNSGAGTGGTTISAVIGSNVTGVIQNSTTSSLTLSNTELYTGATTISAGTLAIGAGGSIANSSGVNLAAASSIFSITAAGAQTIKDLTGVATSQLLLGGNALTLGTANSTAFAGTISGTGGSLIKVGTGTLSLSGTNNYTGGTTINGGAISVAAVDTNLGTGNLTLGGGELVTTTTSATTKTVTLNTGADTLAAAAGMTATYGGVISNGTGGALTVGDGTNTGTVLLSAANTYSGATTINDGTLQVGNGTTGSINNASAVTVAGGATLAFDEATNSTQSNTIADSGTVTTIGTGNITLSGIISGSGAFTQAGSGLATLTGANTYIGATMVNTGGVVVLGNGTTGSISNSSAVTIATGAALDLKEANGSTQSNAITDTGAIDGFEAGGSTNTLSGIISGTGSVSQVQAGTTILAGADVYTGATSATTGTLQIGNGTSGSISASSAASVSGGATLAFDEANGSTQSNAIADAGTVAGAGGAGITNTLSGIISGGGGFSQTGAGTTILSNTNAYSGNTAVNAGTLQIGNGTSGSIANGSAVSVAGGATVAFDEANGSTQSNGIADAGTVVGAEGGGITNTLSGTINGVGGFTQSGAGTTLLTGANGYGGVTTISAGTLQVGNLSALGTSSVTFSAGTLETGNGVHQINVGGTYTQTGGTLVLNLTGTAAGGSPGYEFLNVGGGAGVANLGGALQVVVSAPYVPTVGDMFTFVQAGTINGGFSSVSTNLFSLSITQQGAGIIISQLPFATLPGITYTSNELAIAQYIDNSFLGGASSPAFQTLLGALNSLTAAGISLNALPDAFSQLSPEKFANFTRSTVFNNASFATQELDSYFESLLLADGTYHANNGKLDSSGLTVVDPSMDPALAQIGSRLLAWSPAPFSHGLLSDTTDPVMAGVDSKAMKQTTTAPDSGYDYNAFVLGNVVLAQDFSQADLPHADTTTGAVQVGVDYRITPHLRVGALFGYGHTDADLDNNGSKATVDSYSPGAYVSYANSGWYVNAIGSYGFDNFTEDRHVNFGGLQGVAHGAPSGDQIVGNLDGGYDFHLNRWTLGPTLGVQYTHLDVNSFSEDGFDPVDLSVGKEETDSLRSRLGGHLSYAFQAAKVILTPHLDASWQHEFLDQSRGITSQFDSVGGGSFQIDTPNASRDSALIDGGLSADLDGQTSLYLDYLVQAGQSNYFGQSVQAGVKIGF